MEGIGVAMVELVEELMAILLIELVEWLLDILSNATSAPKRAKTRRTSGKRAVSANGSAWKKGAQAKNRKKFTRASRGGRS